MKILISIIMSFGLMFGTEVYAIFNVAAIKDSNLAINSNGIVDKILVDVDSKVKKGDTLLVLANNDVIENLKMMEAQLLGAKEQYLFAKKQYERFKASGNAIDRNTLEQNYSNYKQLESNYLQSVHRVNLQQELVNRTYLKAPYDGIIASKDIDLGDGVSQNSTKLFRLISKQRKMLIEFDSKYIKDVKIGDVYTFYIDGEKEGFNATIYKIYPAVNESTRKATAEAIIPNSFKPGIFGDGYIKIK